MPKHHDLHTKRIKSGKKGKTRKNKKETGLSISLYADKKNNEVAVKVIDNKSLEVRKEIPPPELEGIKDTLDDILELLFNKRKV